MNASANHWRIWQLVDSALPSGGFAHSGGLESMVQHGLVRSPAALAGILRDVLWQTGHAALPLVRAAHADPGALAALDALCDAFLANRVAHRASRAQGRALLDACARIFPAESASLRTRVRAERLAQHHAPMAGAALATLGLGCVDAQAVVLHWALRSTASAAVRLGCVGPYEAQRMQAEANDVVAQVLTACADLALDDLAQTSPLLETASMAHDSLYSRLFQS